MIAPQGLSFGDIRMLIEEICRPDVATKVGKVWGLDAEGELQGIWRRTGHPWLWIAMGKSVSENAPRIP
ncbi:hypothetical protein JVT61DRAFT_5062 [Boletus reticuloceps]|uniref:Uncharacterized protein n=1 Tax=Boletus reticuloceps TaxID=495285 RepID=A0A8I3ACS7_9AGAM|nr:hypothetical protein JVT61DRAFT_5062 [Boletus reticuloceps]